MAQQLIEPVEQFHTCSAGHSIAHGRDAGHVHPPADFSRLSPRVDADQPALHHHQERGGRIKVEPEQAIECLEGCPVD
jgi:hypothetical protein